MISDKFCERVDGEGKWEKMEREGSGGEERPPSFRMDD